MAQKFSEKGFTLIELLVVLGIIGILLGFVTIDLLRTQHKANVSAATEELVADLQAQQTKAMSGSNDTTGNPNTYGVHVTSNNYILFQGATDPNDATDFTVSPDGIMFVTNLPSNMIVFSQKSGMFSNYVSGSYTITVENTYGTEQRVITLNRYGVITNVQ